MQACEPWELVGTLSWAQAPSLSQPPKGARRRLMKCSLLFVPAQCCKLPSASAQTPLSLPLDWGSGLPPRPPLPQPHTTSRWVCLKCNRAMWLLCLTFRIKLTLSSPLGLHVPGQPCPSLTCSPS